MVVHTTNFQWLFFVSPYILFVREMKQGIMNDYNYHQIAFCCCCGMIWGRRIAGISAALLVISTVSWMYQMWTWDDGTLDDDDDYYFDMGDE